MLLVGPTKYGRCGFIQFGHYKSGEIFIQIFHGDEPESIATVAVVPYGAQPPGDRGVYIKDWNENEGMADALVKAGIIMLTGIKFQTGHVHALHAELTEMAWKEYRDQVLEDKDEWPEDDPCSECKDYLIDYGEWSCSHCTRTEPIKKRRKDE